jgi:hypothetical protein
MLLPKLYYTIPLLYLTLVLEEVQFVHLFDSSYYPVIVRHKSTLYLFVCMISFEMDPLCTHTSWT